MKTFCDSVSTAKELSIPVSHVERVLDLSAFNRQSPFQVHAWTDSRRRHRLLAKANLTKAYRRWLNGVLNFSVVRNLLKAVSTYAAMLFAGGHMDIDRVARDGRL